MRQSCLRASIGGVLLLLSSPVSARDVFTIPNDIPASYADLYKTIKKDLAADAKENISAYLDDAQCGGWNMDLSVKDRIASVRNAPGRPGDWDGNIPSGMAVRDAGMTYPDAAVGLITACEESRFEAQKTAWRDDQQQRVPITVNHPYFEDPPCLWLDNEPVDGPQTPDKCREFAIWTNGFTYADCRAENILPVVDEEGNYLFSFCAAWEDRYVCSDEWVGDGARGNSTACSGAQCRCDGTLASCVRSPENGRPYRSVYRKYEAGYARQNVPDAPKDVTGKNATIACYGLYAEFDPKTHRTEAKDKRCIADIDLSGMKETQKGKGKYGQDSNLPDPLPAKRNEGKFDEQKDLWFTHLGQAFSLLNDVLFADSYDRSLGKALSDRTKLDKAAQKATVQLTDEKPLAEHSFTRAFDDTAESRLLATWWQRQQTRMQTYVHGPVLRLILPATWAIGASTDPFLESKPAQSRQSVDARSERIEVQIRASDDSLGEAISFIERSLTLQVREEPLPVILPLADPAELRATAAAWCAWVSSETGKAGCDDAEADVKTLMEDLYGYADAIEDYRMLRSETAAYAAALLKLQQDVTKPLTDWMKKNIDDYKRVVASRASIARQIEPLLTKAQELLQSFHDETNMPWCMNQRFTLPVYSLLDPWLPSRAKGGSVSADDLPSLPDPTQVPEDIVLDLSKVSYMQTSVTVPVLKPVQVRLDLPRPPDTDAISALPDIGADVRKIRDMLKRSRDALPAVKQKGSPPGITLPKAIPAETVAEMTSAAQRIVEMFTGMKKTYEEFWTSMGPLEPAAANAPAGEGDENSKLREKKRKLECDWDTFPCVHVEMDLIERLTRVGSRPLVMLKEDYQSTGSGRTLPTDCPPEDHVCLLMHPEKNEPAQGWEIRGPAAERTVRELDGMRSSLRSLSFPSPLGTADKTELPPYDVPAKELLPGIESSPASPLVPSPAQ